MNPIETWLGLLHAGIAVLISCVIIHFTFVWCVLKFFGKVARGKVLSSVAQKQPPGTMASPESRLFFVTYEFTATTGSKGTAMCVGQQTMMHEFRHNDFVAVRYWPKWPRICRIADRAI